jgi:hypothetical protein
MRWPTDWRNKTKRFVQQTFLPKHFRQPSIPKGFQPRTPAEEFFLNGYVRPLIKKTPVSETLLELLRSIKNGPLPEGFHWEQKAQGYYLLRPKPVELHSAFVDFLFENRIMEFVEELTGQPLGLADIVYIHHKPGIQNAWHRDTYFYDGVPVGPVPAVFKMIFYPTLGEPSKKQLAVIPGSHRRTYFDRITDESQIRKRNTRYIMSDDERYLFFDSTILHAVEPETEPVGSYRLHYLFAPKLQLAKQERYKGNQTLHDIYEERRLTFL